MRRLALILRQTLVLLSKLKYWPIMATTSDSCEPTVPQKRLKLDENICDKQLTKHSNDWRSKLVRNFDETDVGITEFIGDFKPFEAVLKNRYEDFLVHEISKSGEIIRLTDNSVPKDEVIPVLDIYEVLDDNTLREIKQLLPIVDKTVNECSDETIDDKPDVGEVIEPEIDLNEDKCESFEENENKTDANECLKSVVKISVNGLSKWERTRIHKAIRDNYESLETLTVDEESDKYILVKRFDKTSAKRNPNQWPKDKGEYIHFVLYKENKETQQAINELALKMNISAKNFDIAGTKDKRAITTQRVSAWKVPPKKIWSAAQRCSFVEVGHFRFDKFAINLGDLKGNQFDIVLRDVKCEDRENAEQSLNCVKTIGFINYYGMQRFGYQYSKPYITGILILKQKWEEVVERILAPKPNDMRFHNRPNALSFNECIELWRQTRNAQEVYKKFPYKWTPEGSLLKGLSRVGPNDFHGAICTGLVRNQRLLYLHCYQSYLWNKIASFRVKTYGVGVVAGDMLLKDREKELKSEQIKDLNSANIVIADQNNLNSASIYDIVLPVMGSDNLWPTNCVKEYIESLLAEDNVTIDMFRDLPKQWCCFGTYRKLFVRPENFEFQWIRYNDPNIPLIESDLSLINKINVSDVESQTDLVTNNETKCKKLALKLTIDLPSSCYATMFCRQITRTETTVLENKSWLKDKYSI